MESAVHAAVPLRVGKKMRKRRELDALVGGGGSRSSRLLSASSDEGEPWGRRTARRRRSRPFVRLAAALSLCVCVVSAATVLWLFVDVRRQIVSLRMEMDRVSTSSSSVGDALQVCHTAAKELRANATDFNIRLAKLEQEHQELAKRVEEAGATIAAVSEKLAAAPMLADTPNRLAELQRTVAYFGSQIKGYDASIESAHKQALNAAMGVEDIKTLLQQLHAKTNETVANVSANMKAEDELKAQVSALNGTLTARVEELQSKVLEISRSTSTVAPTTSTTTTTTAATPASSSAPSVTTPPGSPAKPMVSN
ncbi:uncharacterized protein LOC131853820 isoform X1 [Achroia grisella]|uniref:uncharacterized protein LOC131853820 isoform X1 n=1 Tax=Achroia grisella TaxID=688607 RepID=UPI0027D31371|nr:uncharacterized protein LOC131853820 isoform X1 [Achroia grisella]XP_059060852.1 uncharacterized protein LOC131853820 isoform X1 [Achroia grisella]XP_059060853.1 uncharacterized protein LOC131853820 isoform X1 [Achroia grisella]XP_059060854.1 uncharacterized protein LOC131853820 isoform X1 [Achroia grisella]XP_059060855.1 uncharacterized protein LOC131853820 isoform X1 [Achroia grisella]XP_059060856.1 uncharacterized protein LOC131853820 isoform X1 [Achroia grisella]